MRTRVKPTDVTRSKLSIAQRKAWAGGRRTMHPNTLNNFRNLNKGKFGANHPASEANHPAWKGDQVGYLALHSWIRRRKGTPQTCVSCQKTGLTGQKIHWANIDGRYSRNLEDWIRLCAKCHRAHDDKNKLRGLDVRRKK